MLHSLLGDMLLPASITPHQLVLLLTTSFIASLITAAMGIGGGLLLLAVSATTVPAAALIPVHGLVQLGSNANRAILTRRHLSPGILGNFGFGALAGTLLASVFVIQLPVNTIQFTVALFILYLVWGPPIPASYLTGWPLRIAAGITTFISMFVGATGPLVAAILKQRDEDRFIRTANLATCMSVQHGFKLLLFGWLGFSFTDWLGAIAAMILCGLLGTWVGLHVLSKINNRYFNLLFKLILTLLAVRLLYNQLNNLLT